MADQKKQQNIQQNSSSTKKKDGKANDKSKKSSVGEKIALILAGIILVPTVVLTACIILAQTTDMNFDWLADKAAAIEAEADAAEEAQIAEEEAAAAAKEQAAAEAASGSSSSSSSSSSETTVNVELIDNTAALPVVTEESTDNTIEPADVTVENDLSEDGSASASVTGNLSDMVWMTDDGDYYHKDASCSGMINPKQTTMQDAIYAGKSPCSKCYNQ